MKTIKKILLLGGGGHCKVVIDTITAVGEYSIAGIIDVREKVGSVINNVPVIGTDQMIADIFRQGITHACITVGSVGNPQKRISLYRILKKIGYSFPNLVHPDAILAPSVSMGEGNYIAPRVIINSDVQLRNNCIINTGAIIEHDCILGDFVHIAPGAVLSGAVRVGNYSHVGAGSSVIENITIGEDTIIGAGSAVVHSISSKVVAYGNPCVEQRKNHA